MLRYSWHTPLVYANLVHESNKFITTLKNYKQLFTECLENKDIRCIHWKEGGKGNYLVAIIFN